MAGTDADAAVASAGRTRLAELHRSFRLVQLAGLCLLAIGTVLLVGYAPLQDWPLYPLITPLVMGLGAGLILYGSRASSRRPSRRPSTTATAGSTC
ncbi:MAG: hypothetical protein ACXV3A_10505 [Kineosporiaceae bacterium]